MAYAPWPGNNGSAARPTGRDGIAHQKRVSSHDYGRPVPLENVLFGQKK